MSFCLLLFFLVVNLLVFVEIFNWTFELSFLDLEFGFGLLKFFTVLGLDVFIISIIEFFFLLFDFSLLFIVFIFIFAWVLVFFLIE